MRKVTNHNVDDFKKGFVGSNSSTVSTRVLTQERKASGCSDMGTGILIIVTDENENTFQDKK